jgi:hypothetical protein
MWTADIYCLRLPDMPDAAVAERVFDLVWRFDFAAPGFGLLDVGPGVDSHTLRSWMVRLKEALSEVGAQRHTGRFAYRSMARFDQQETTKFHLDGAPDQSMLMLGYEPSRVHSRLMLADYTRAAFDLGITPQRFLEEFNPMFRRGADVLERYVTEMPPPADGHARILLVNNSAVPWTADRLNPLGVMHKADIIDASETKRRIVNSTMLAIGDLDEVGREQQQAFVTTDRISEKKY